ncbi:MAG: hypothetical protein CMI53_02490 [Parcubacteria group bacterium]|nr:hypothetical protein [Parcubacteria group bacterium]|tara:strand:+ start:1194 stop:2585 length:1392 start_codon:yes stop_codon:yes gene_type:complete
MNFDWLLIILAAFLFWPRGYVLVYLIDRSKSFSFGFKFFAGWLLGLAGFTLDMFASMVFGGLSLGPLLLVMSSVTQIFGFSFMIYIFEKRIPWPNPLRLTKFIKRQVKNFKSFSSWEHILLLVLVLTLLFRVSVSAWQINNIPTYDFDAWNNWNLRAKVIYSEDKIPLDKTDQFYLGGGIKSYPLNDSLFKAYIALAVGKYEDRYSNLAGLFYYLLLLGLFYFSLPDRLGRGIKLIATYLLSSIPLLYFHSHVPYADLLFAIFLFMAVASMFYYLIGRGNSFYYLSGMGLAFSIWTKNEGLSIILPIFIITTIILLSLKKVKLKDFLLQWFFAFLTVTPWLFYRTINRLDYLSGDSSTFNFVYNYQFFSEVFSSIFLRSHFNFLYILILIIIILKIKPIWKDFGLAYLVFSFLAILLAYNSIILFTDKALDLSALARVNMQLVPVAVLLLVFFIHKFFAKIKV